MIPVVCRVKHDPDNGTYGDCVRACIASIMELDAEQVPHFHHDNCVGQIANERISKWLARYDFAPFRAVYSGEYPIEQILQLMDAQNPTTYYMLFGRTATGEDHVVVCRGGQIAHNPAWYGGSLVGAATNGFWSVMVIARS